MSTKNVNHKRTIPLPRNGGLASKRPKCNVVKYDKESGHRSNPRCVVCGIGRHQKNSTCSFYVWKLDQISLGIKPFRCREEDGRQITQDEFWRQAYLKFIGEDVE